MKAYTIHKPTIAALPLVFDSPHSGRVYPDDFGYACDFEVLRSAEDHFVDELFSHVTGHGASLLCAEFPRSYVDVNRRCDDIDPTLLDAPWSDEAAICPTTRSHAGIGLIRRLIHPGAPVYNRALSEAEIMRRIADYYHPYHDALRHLLGEAHYNFGQVYHINCHSMPASSAVPKRAIGLIGNTSKAADFVLGDQDGTTCDVAFTRALAGFIKSLGYHVAINDPFKGVECIQKHAAPARGYHCLQIEINKALYLDEKTGEKSDGFEGLKASLEKITVFIADYVRAQLVMRAAD